MIMQKLTKKESGFTLIELMIVIAIIGILAAIAIPNFISFRKRGYDNSALSDARNAYTAALAFYAASPGDNSAVLPTETNLTDNGYKKSPGITLTIAGTGMSAFTLSCVHAQGTITYTIDQDGAITKA